MTSTQLNQVYFNPKQLKLPLSFDIKILFDSEVRTFDDVFRRIDLNKYIVVEHNVGRTGYNPVNMLKLILFCQMENIFYDLNQYIIDQEKIDTKTLFIDGTKIEVNANKYKFIWKGSIEKFRDKLYHKMTKQILKLNDHYQEMGIFFPIYETYEAEYLKRILDFLSREVDKTDTSFVYGKGTRKTALQRDYEALFDYHTKLNEYNDYIRIIGADRNSCARTDHDATFMHMKEDYMRNGQLKAGYNVQIGVSDEYILHLDIFQERNDYQTFIPFLEGYRKAHGFYPKYPVADAG